MRNPDTLQSKHRKMRSLFVFKRMLWMVALVAAGTRPSVAQQPEDLQKQLERIGVFEALERAGVQVGDTVKIGAWETEWGV